MARWMTITAWAAAFVFAACGGNDKEGGANTKAKRAAKAASANSAPAKSAGPKLDCAAFEKQMNECIDPFSVAYAKTPLGSKPGQKTIGGEVDEALAAKRFKMLWRIAGVQLCSGGPKTVSLPFEKKDAPWKARFASCASKTTCDDWVPCMAAAMGQPLSPR